LVQLGLAEGGSVKLLSLTLRNFKGIRDLTICPNGNDLSIFGDNATGKTTIEDAYTWLLFGKDSLNQADFEIKTIDQKTGETINKIDHSVEGVFDIGGTHKLILTRIFREDWSTTRGTNDKTFKGHTVEYQINNVPVSKGAYDDKIASLCNPEVLRILSNAAYFNTFLDWKKMRRMLLDVCGNYTDAEVIAANHALRELPAILGERTVDEHRAYLAGPMKKVSESLKSMPDRVDENFRAIADRATTGEIKPVAEFETRLAALREQKARVIAGGEVSKLKARVSEIDANQSRVIQRLRQEATKDYDAAMVKVREKQTELNTVVSDLGRLTIQLAADKDGLAIATDSRDAKRAEFATENAKQFEWTGAESCDACGQSLPAERIAEVRAQAESNFNLAKSVTLQKIKDAGQSLNESITKLEGKIADKTAESDRLILRRAELETEVETLQDSANGLVTGEPDPSTDEEYARLASEKESVKGQIAQLEGGNVSRLAELDEQITVVQSELSEVVDHNAAVNASKQSHARIKELEEDEKRLNAEYEQYKKELHLLDEFIKAKVKMLTESINSKFTLARFKLFDVQINGGISECCETTVNGVPYSSLNNGTRVNVGLDIINTLADHFGFAPPIFIDNAESVTSLLATTGQQIRLVVSASDKSLRIEGEATTAQKELAI
jgi:hypothetical protein